MKKIRFCLGILLSCNLILSAQWDTINVEGTNRIFYKYIPDNLPENEKVPLLIGLHPYGNTAAGFQALTGFSNIADDKKFIVVYPQGIGNSWNAGGCCAPASTQGVDDVGFISALIDTMIKKSPIDSNKVYLTGFSNGGILSYRLAAEIPEKIRGIAPSGALYMMTNEIEATKPISIIHFHALNDGSVNFNGFGSYMSVTELLNKWRDINSITAEPDTFCLENNITGILHASTNDTANIILLTSVTGGHNWNINQYLHTSELIWEFFSTGKATVEFPPVTSIEENRNNDLGLKVYPLPVHDILTFEINPLSSGLFKIEVINNTGQVILEDEKYANAGIINPISINVSNLQKGNYYVRLSNNNYNSMHPIIIN